jgi:hypothetical protein
MRALQTSGNYLYIASLNKPPPSLYLRALPLQKQIREAFIE